MNSCLEAFKHGISVKPIRRVIEFADAEIFIKEGVRYDSSRTPYVKEIGNALSYDSPTQQVTVVKGQQLGITELLKLVIAQMIAENPDNIIYGLPSISTAIQFSKSKLQKMIDNSPVLSRLVSDASSRDGTNTTLMKEYPGGHINIVTSNSGAEWRMKDALFVALDEYDEHKDVIDGQGSGKEIAEGRTAAKGESAKIALVSTPIEMAKSKIWVEFLAGSQEYYHVPCPFCTVKQVMKWENFKYEKGDINSIRLKCINETCGKLIEEKHKTWMLENGEWVAHNPNRQNKLHRSFHLSSFYSPIGFLSWSKILQKWFDCKGDKAKRQAFSQLVEANPYEEPDEEQTPIEELLGRRYKFNTKISNFIVQNYKNLFSNGVLMDERRIVPKEVLLLTSGWDTQDKWIEGYVIGWGLNDQWWLIDHQRFDAPEGRYVDHQIIWDELEIWRKRVYIHENGHEMHIHRICHDTGGHYADPVYNHVRGKYSQGVYATKGSSTPGAPLISAPSKSNKGRIPLHFIGTDTAKRTIFGKLRAKKPSENGYFHIPDWCTDEMCRQFLSEKLVVERKRNAKGYFENIKTYKKTRERNEGLDCLVGAYCAMKSIKPFVDWVKLSEVYMIKSEEIIEDEANEYRVDDEIPVNEEEIPVDNNENNDMEAETNEEANSEIDPEVEEPTDFTKTLIQQRKYRPVGRSRERNLRRNSWWKRR